MKNFPTLNEILENPAVKSLMAKLGRGEIVSTAVLVMGELAQQTRQSATEMTLPTVTDVANRIAARITEGDPTRLVPTINATGDLFPPELGPPPLAAEAINAMADLARDYSAMGRPLSDWSYQQPLKSVESLFSRLIGAESVIAVNSPMSAWLLLLTTLGKPYSVRSTRDRDVVTGAPGGIADPGFMPAPNTSVKPEKSVYNMLISRGQLCQFSEGCRITDIMADRGVECNDVGSVNCTTIEDFERGYNDGTAAVLYIHSSHFRLSGQTSFPLMTELAKFSRSRKVPFIVDIGLGNIWPIEGDETELSAASCLEAGADAVILRSAGTFGGPSCGVILGKRAILDKCRHCTLAPAVFCDPLILTALEQTLLLYAMPDKGTNSVPLRQLLDSSEANLHNRALRLKAQISLAPFIESVEIESTFVQGRPTRRLWLKPKVINVNQLKIQLTKNSPAILTRIINGCCVMDLRTVLSRQDMLISEAFVE